MAWAPESLKTDTSVEIGEDANGGWVIEVGIGSKSGKQVFPLTDKAAEKLLFQLEQTVRCMKITKREQAAGRIARTGDRPTGPTHRQ